MKNTSSSIIIFTADVENLAKCEGQLQQCQALRLRLQELSMHGESVLAAYRLMLVPENKNIIKRCSCGMEYTSNQWFRLPLVGYQYDASFLRGEMRTCSCRSTLFFVSNRNKKS